MLAINLRGTLGQ